MDKDYVVKAKQSAICNFLQHRIKSLASIDRIKHYPFLFRDFFDGKKYFWSSFPVSWACVAINNCDRNIF